MKASKRLEKKKSEIIQKYKSQQRESSLNSNKPPRDSRNLSDNDLVEKLSKLKLAITREQLDELIRGKASYDEVTDEFINDNGVTLDGDKRNWIRFCLTELWKRWFPDRPAIEHVHELIYKMARGSENQRCKLSLEAWRLIMQIMERKGIKTVIEYNQQCNKMNYDLLEWLEQMSIDLWNEGPNDDRALTNRLQFCHELLARLPEKDEQYNWVIENINLALAETLFSLRSIDEGNALFSKWLEADPKWGAAWVGWSDGFSRNARTNEERNLQRSVQILHEGLKVDGLRDRDYVMQRLADVYEMMKRFDEAQELLKQIKRKSPN